jgi:hypothetical protein
MAVFGNGVDPDTFAGTTPPKIERHPIRTPAALTLPVLTTQHASADRRGVPLQGEWRAVELRTAKGAGTGVYP